ncbi:EamA family transporter [Streptomyces sp. M19]
MIALGVAPAATGVCPLGHRRTGDPRWAATTGTAVVGCALLLAPGGTRVDPLGLVMAVAAGTCYGLYTVFAKHLASVTRASDLPTLSALSLLAGALPLLPWMVTDSVPLRDGSTLALVGWLGLATTAIAYWLFTAGLVRVRATTVGTLSPPNPWRRP